jgi:hypothetical protein
VAVNPDDKTVPAGYHLETVTDGSGVRRRIAVQNSPDENPKPGSSNQNTPTQESADPK